MGLVGVGTEYAAADALVVGGAELAGTGEEEHGLWGGAFAGEVVPSVVFLEEDLRVVVDGGLDLSGAFAPSATTEYIGVGRACVDDAELVFDAVVGAGVLREVGGASGVAGDSWGGGGGVGEGGGGGGVWGVGVGGWGVGGRGVMAGVEGGGVGWLVEGGGVAAGEEFEAAGGGEDGASEHGGDGAGVVADIEGEGCLHTV